MVRKALRLFALALLPVVCAAAAVYIGSFTAGPPKDVDLTIYAQRYYFDPPVITLNRGDRVTLNLITRDVTHGFYLEGHDIDAKIQPKHSPEDNSLLLRHPSKGYEYQEVDRIKFVADQPGKFRYRCSVTCGTLHPFMQGEMIVRPNHAFWGEWVFSWVSA